jgi:hypothetical protein
MAEAAKNCRQASDSLAIGVPSALSRVPFRLIGRANLHASRLRSLDEGQSKLRLHFVLS